MSRQSYKAVERHKKIASMSKEEAEEYLRNEKRVEPEEGSAGSVQRVVGCYVAVNQALVDEIVRRAKESEYGLNEPEKKPDITQYQPWDIDMLALCLVSSWTEKYDLVSVFAAAMSVIEEKAANADLRQDADSERGT